MAGRQDAWSASGALVLVAALLASVALGLVSGCGNVQPPVGSGAPVVTMVWPLPGEDGVAVDTAAAVHFNVPMDRAAVISALRVTPKVGLGPEWKDDAVLSIVPSPAWPEGTRVTIEVGRGAKSASGIPIDKPYRWSFTVCRQYLGVAAAEPGDGAVGVALDSPVQVTFDRPLDQATLAGAVQVAPNVPGQVRLVNDITLLFTPDAEWGASATYRLTVKGGAGGVKARDGHALEADYTTSFGTVLQTVLAEVDVDTGAVRALARLADRAVGAVWSPDAQRIALAIQVDVPEADAWGFFGGLWVYDPATGALDKVGEGSLWTESNDLNNVWSPDGSTLLYSDAWHPERPAGVWRARPGGTPELIASSQSDDMMKTANPAWSPDGARIAYRLYGDWMSHIYVSSSDGTGRREIARFPIKVSEYSFRGLHWSPGGTYISVEEEDPQSGGALAIMLLDPGGSGDPGSPGGQAAARRLCRGWRHSWSPDGTRIALVDDAVRIIDVASGHATTVARPTGLVRWGPCWSPDGLYVAFEAAPDPESAAEGVWVARADGSGASQVTTAPTWGVKSWSPSGHRLLLITTEAAVQ